ANVLIMPAIHSASISTKLLAAAGGAQVLGPLLIGLARPVQICRLGAPVSDIVTMATMAAYDISARDHALVDGADRDLSVADM
ncbi:MAG TPA: phosphate acyltransferase, partial [Paracoccaceae bacterium]|nr:phosphate acyltransferase [Paracoccaceae bacterium]